MGCTSHTPFEHQSSKILRSLIAIIFFFCYYFFFLLTLWEGGPRVPLRAGDARGELGPASPEEGVDASVVNRSAGQKYQKF